MRKEDTQAMPLIIPECGILIGMKLKCHSTQIKCPGTISEVTSSIVSQDDDMLLKYLLDYLGNEKLKYNTDNDLSSKL